MELKLHHALSFWVTICLIRELRCVSLHSTSHYEESGLVHTLVCSWKPSENAHSNAASTLSWHRGNEPIGVERNECVLANSTVKQLEFGFGYLYQTLTISERNVTDDWSCSLGEEKSNNVNITPISDPRKVHLGVDKIISYPGGEITFSCTKENESIALSDWHIDMSAGRQFYISNETREIIPSGNFKDTRNVINRTTATGISSTSHNITMKNLSLADNGLKLNCSVASQKSNVVEVIVLEAPELPDNVTLTETSGDDLHLDNSTLTLTCTATCESPGYYNFTWDIDLEGTTYKTFHNSCESTCSQTVTIPVDSGQKKAISCTVNNLRTGKNLTGWYESQQGGEGSLDSEDKINPQSVGFGLGVAALLGVGFIALAVLKGRKSLLRDNTVYIESPEYATCNDDVVTTEEFLSTRLDSRPDKTGSTTNEYFCLEESNKVMVENTLYEGGGEVMVANSLYEGGGVAEEFQLKDTSSRDSP